MASARCHSGCDILKTIIMGEKSALGEVKLAFYAEIIGGMGDGVYVAEWLCAASLV